jgi:hypothetical protein
MIPSSNSKKNKRKKEKGTNQERKRRDSFQLLLTRISTIT